MQKAVVRWKGEASESDDSHEEEEEETEEESEGLYADISELEIRWPSRIILVAPSESGKTNLLKHLVYQNRDEFDHIWFFGKNQDEETWLPRNRRMKDVSQKAIQKIWDFQKKNKHLRCLICLDDCLAEDFSSMFWKDFLSSCRHQNISVVFSIQYLKSCPPALRENVRDVFILHANNRTTAALYELNCSDISKREFQSYVSSHCSFGQVVHMNCSPHAKHPLQTFSVGKARNFRLQ